MKPFVVEFYGELQVKSSTFSSEAALIKPIKCLDLGVFFFKKKLDQKQHIHIIHKCVCVCIQFS